MIHVRRLLLVTMIAGLLAGCAAFEKADKVVMSGQAESAVFNIEYTHIEQQVIKPYMQKYAWTKTKPKSIRFYLFGDKQAVARAATKLIGAVSVALVSDMQANMDLTGLIALGIGIDLAVPEQVQAEERKLKEDSQPEKSEVEA